MKVNETNYLPSHVDWYGPNSAGSLDIDLSHRNWSTINSIDN